MKRLDAWWSAVEVALVVFVTALLAGSLVLWVCLKGLSSRTTDTFFAGLVFRALVGMLVAGGLTHRFGRRPWLTTLSCAVGITTSWLWRDVGVEWATNVLGWLQDGSTLTLFGGLRGFGTRLTLWLALLGASLATASGRHVSIDVAKSALGEAARAPLARLGGVVAAAVCLVSAWGFFDFTAVDAFAAAPGSSASSKVATVLGGVSRHTSFVVRQLTSDVQVMPSVLSGTSWSTLPDLLIATPGEATRGLLVKTMNLIVPLGLLLIALRFLLWVLMGPGEEPHPIILSEGQGPQSKNGTSP